VVGVSLLSAGLSFAPVSAASANIETVMPNDLALNNNDWYFYDDTNDVPSTAEVAGKYQFVAGPQTPPTGKGSLRFDNTGTERWNLATKQFAGTKLSDLKKLSFSTYQPNTNTSNPQYSVYLNFDVDFDGPGGDDAYQGRLVYVPRSNGVVQQNTWQKWSAVDSTSMWTWSRLAGNGNVWKDSNPNANRSWQDIVAAFPNATIATQPNAGQLLFRSGEPYPDGFTGYLDKLVFKLKGDDKVGYDLEPSLAPQDTNACKNKGWKTFNDPSFDSQEECVKFVKYGDDHNHHHNWWGNRHDRDYDRWDDWGHDNHHRHNWDRSWDN
jgi:hypothetical protein